MAKYILSKKAKGKKYQYTVTDEKGNVVSTRTSARDYVACTANGGFYFGRLDLIGKGDHGKGLSRTTEILENTERAYKKKAAYLYRLIGKNFREPRRRMDCPETERYPFSYDGADFDQWGDCEFGIHD